ncbi:gem-associated protein 7-like isoform X2 [Thrips palmi]|uniref:Gem-associated protein 7-like isoform X2 n=1 Tax=Thrips palmi TaxID=161013 RepID=A0A6P8Z4W9_THRPL|nr:gem-associated protein 7-like isoform X2 [Thrips palmi]XP_034247527.1 gem-associated protein 7-like isoform X2 [Thrips palmi]XP_034247528.1 gem-associated protein 7-like isoform X2 [Thrips palmi]XP_034247529.1 gem-associated protein 7-like isoform X2 [Thrips palmi]
MTANCPEVPSLIPSKEEEVQQARSYLRERFIRALLAMNGRTANFRMYENTNVSAVFGSCDREFVNIYVKSLDTPLGSIPDALLRTNDIECISINEIDPSA